MNREVLFNLLHLVHGKKLPQCILNIRLTSTNYKTTCYMNSVVVALLSFENSDYMNRLMNMDGNKHCSFEGSSDCRQHRLDSLCGTLLHPDHDQYHGCPHDALDGKHEDATRRTVVHIQKAQCGVDKDERDTTGAEASEHGPQKVQHRCY